MTRQISLLPETDTSLMQFRNRSVEDTTFLGKLGLPIHRWYRLTASFSPALAKDILDFFRPRATDVVLDPFCGVGTVPLVSKHAGLKAVGVEINPFLAFVARAKLRDYQNLDRLEMNVRAFLQRYRAEVEEYRRLNPHEFLRLHEDLIPKIHEPLRWWTPKTLRDLVLAKLVVLETDGIPVEHLDFIKMGILSILVPVSNAEHNHVSLTFLKQSKKGVDVLAILEMKLRDMLHDLRITTDLPTAQAEILGGNSRSLADVMGTRKADILITSPPYPNRFSYARETRPHLFFFDFLNNRDDVGQLEVDAIGGTWGKATSVLSRRMNFKSEHLRALLESTVRKIRRDGEILANYVVKYFNDMEEHAGQVARIVSPSAKIAYVIGNSKFYGHEIRSDETLAEIFGAQGFKTISVERMRKRNSKAGLYEAVLLMNRREG